MGRILLPVLILLALVSILLGGCTRPDEARRALEAAGYTDIEMHGYDWLACGEEGGFHDRFTATGPTGRFSSGVVCGGWFKGQTIRLD